MSGGSLPAWPSCVSRCQALLIIACLFPKRKPAAAGLEEKGELGTILPATSRWAKAGRNPRDGWPKQAIRAGMP